ncbi:MAG: hypothetical protein C0402_11285 [Thermodesulfovibrio sp.]|nr:hypothetical protein [Thermodesulfovibrio sp.]
MGQIIHLAHDLAVPAHVRNDPHGASVVNYDMYEAYTKSRIGTLSYGGYGAVAQDLFDKFWTNSGKGLADFTNRSFLSRNTNIDDAKYSLPVPIGEWIARETFVDPLMGSMQFDVKYLQGYATDNYRPVLSRQIDRLSAYSYLDFEMQKYGFTQRVYSLNDRIHREYASFLIPRAVGYSAGLLDYFFRGDIKLTFQSGSSPGYVISNNSKEDLTGLFEIYSDNSQDERMQVWRGKLTINASQKSTVISLPIISDAKEPGKYTLVFRGKMGNEDDAVAGYVTSRRIKITPPAQYVYATADGATAKAFDKIRVKLRNMSITEAMPNGMLQAIVKYKKPGQAVFSYAASDTIAAQRLEAGAPREAAFDFSSNSVPLDATNVYLYVVYTGTIGTEANAVAVGEKDISEPTPVDLFNNMDRICLNAQWYTAGSPAAVTLFDKDKDGRADQWDVYSHDVQDIYIRFSPDNAPRDASPAEYNYHYAKIDPGAHRRVLYILTDYQFSYGIYNKWLRTPGGGDLWTHIDESFLFPGHAVKDQTEVTSDPAICGSRASCPKVYTPTYYTYRGTDMWWGAGLIYVNIPYPETAVCP